jgi:hypothetical protein
MHAENSKITIDTSSVSSDRRDLLAGIAAIEASLVAEATAETEDMLAWLIDEADELRRQSDALEEKMEALASEPTARISASVRMSDVIPSRRGTSTDHEFRWPFDVMNYFGRKIGESVGCAEALQFHTHKMNAALELLRLREEESRLWRKVSGYNALWKANGPLIERLGEIEEKICLFPCRDYATVARKVDYVTRMLNDDEQISGKYAMAIMRSMAGLSHGWPQQDAETPSEDLETAATAAQAA